MLGYLINQKRNLNFSLKKFDKFKNKIIYLVLDNEPSNIEQIKAVRDFETIYGPWSITRITQTK